MSAYNGCIPDPENTLGDFNLVGQLLVALNVAVGVWGGLTILQLGNKIQKAATQKKKSQIED